MSCYFRHLEGLFAEAGIEVTVANRKDLDRAIHTIVGETYKNCPATWKQIKLAIADPQHRQEFVEKLRNAMK